jgi:hypothetical protein
MGTSLPTAANEGTAHERLWRVLTEELKTPLLQIARQAELNRADPAASTLESIETAAEQALRFVDSYLLSQQLNEQLFVMEPVAVSAVLQAAAHQLERLARQYNCQVELHLSGRYGPVMAHRQGLEAALMGIGATLITGQVPTDKRRPVITLAAHKSASGGIVAGVFGAQEGLSEAVYRQGKALVGRARQPLGTAAATTGAGIFIADAIFAAMSAQLRIARHHKLTGLAATLNPSKQLALV